MDRPRDLAQWNISKIMTACCQITCTTPWSPCEQLPYLPEHPRVSRMRQRDKSDLPLPVLSYKYFLLRYSFICHPTTPKSTSLAAALFEDSKNSSKNFFQQPSSFRSSPLQENGHQLHRTWGQFYSPPVFSLLPCSSAVHLTEYSLFFFLFCSSFYPQKHLGSVQ